MAIPPYVRSYYTGALETAPAVLNKLLESSADDNALWDFRPYADRFTLKEALAHVADWDDIWIERISTIRDEDHPVLPDKDEGAIAIERDYAQSSPQGSLARLKASRPRLVDLVQSLDPEAWDRPAYKENLGEVILSDIVTLVTMHDSYHVRQVLEYQELFATKRG